MLTNLQHETAVHPPVLRPRAMRAVPRRTTDWRQALPVLSNGVLTLRELRMSDARGPARAAHDRRGLALHFAAADDGRRVRALHRLGAARARRRALHLLRGRSRRHGHRDRHLPGTATRSDVLDGRMGLRHRPGVLGLGRLHGRGPADHRLLIRDRRRPPAGGQGGRRQRARQRRARQDRRRQGSDSAPELPAQRTASRPVALVDRAGRLASGQSRVGCGRSLMALIHRPTACAAGGYP